MVKRKKKGRRKNPWTRGDVVSYVIDAYAGTEENGKRPRRVFIWAEADGEVWIGNSAAFAEHVAKTFGFPLFKYDYANLNRILIEMGERVHEPQRRSPAMGPPQLPYQPDKRRAR